MLLRDLLRPFPKKLKSVPAGRLLVWGKLAGGDKLFGPEDLRALPAEFQIADVAQYKPGYRGRAVRLAGIVAAAAPKSGSLHFNAASRDGKQLLAFWRTEVEQLGLVVYELDGQPLAQENGGPFRLVLPGFHGTRARIDDLACIELGDQPEGELSI